MNDDRQAVGSQVNSKVLSLRKVIEEDCQLLWDWVNEPSVRAVSFSSESISWQEHFAWFNQKIKDFNCHFFMVLDRENRPIGQIRFDQEESDRAIISIAIAPEERGLGYGSLAINLAVNEIFHKTSICQIFAFIKPENSASIRTFEKNGFTNEGMISNKGYSALKYVRIKSG